MNKKDITPKKNNFLMI